MSEEVKKILKFCQEQKELKQNVSIITDNMTAWAEAMAFDSVLKYIKELEKNDMDN